SPYAEKMTGTRCHQLRTAVVLTRDLMRTTGIIRSAVRKTLSLLSFPKRYFLKLPFLKLSFLTLMIAQPLPAAQDKPPVPCSSAQHRAFDFWLGNWTAYDESGKRQGSNHLKSILDGCAMQENWDSGKFKGTSYNFYDPVPDKWYQTWVDNQGGHLFLRGGLVGNAMVLAGEASDEKGNHWQDRITWTPLPDGRVRQHWQRTADGGQTWQNIFDGYYQKAAE
ncbi:MAG: hypothetical protein KDI36_09670, partial [Pseudomonadales bacterium]|nr:hypothetical protein [Pseudomonadales bacterium]